MELNIYTCGPRISGHAFSLDGELNFYLKNWFYLLENDLKLSLIFVLFLKGKQNKKKNPKCDSLFEKSGLWKIGLGSRVKLLIGKVR